MSGEFRPTMTVGQIREALARFPDDTHVVAYLEATEYVNVVGLDSTQHDEEVRLLPEYAPAAVVLDLVDDYDSRQW